MSRGMGPRREHSPSDGDKHFSRLLFGGLIALSLLLIAMLAVAVYLHPLAAVAIAAIFVVPYAIGSVADWLWGLPPT